MTARINWFLVAAAVAVAPSMAGAADLPARMPVKAPAYMAPAPVGFSWTGFYIGANVGWGWSNGDGTFYGLGPVGVPVSGSGDGVLGGGQIGYNWQTGSFIFGIETDFQGSSGEGDLNGSAGGVAITGGTLKTPWFGTIRGRIGYAPWDRGMIYVTGGGAYGHLDYDGTLSTTGPFSSSTNYWTWTVGAGVEAFLWDRWSAKLEYLYVGTPDNFPVPPGTVAADGNTNTNIVRAGLNYHF
ncbi:MAG TPA: outer membrane protein [Pseudolabrys sp.]|nr:outer membrane protein [Pseudolabrys sp.]